MEALTKLIMFVEEHQALLAQIPGAVDDLFDAVVAILNRGTTSEEKKARIEALAVEIRAMRDAYRNNPPQLPK